MAAVQYPLDCYILSNIHNVRICQTNGYIMIESCISLNLQKMGILRMSELKIIHKVYKTLSLNRHGCIISKT